MEHVLIIHAVKDYLAWKRVFDNAASLRKEAGVEAPQFVYLHKLEEGVL